jgi:hypothetical protein
MASPRVGGRGTIVTLGAAGRFRVDHVHARASARKPAKRVRRARGRGRRGLGPFAAAQPVLAAIAEAPVDAAILDVNLGRGGTSDPVAAELRRRRVPFVFLTGSGIEAIDPDSVPPGSCASRSARVRRVR